MRDTRQRRIKTACINRAQAQLFFIFIHFWGKSCQMIGKRHSEVGAPPIPRWQILDPPP